MSAARVPVSLEEEVSLHEQVPRFTLSISRARSDGAMELPQVVPASRLADRPAPATVLTGIAELDSLIGGLPRGALSEICGPASSGRTSLLLALMQSMTAQGEVCALVDATDSFHPESAETAGVDLRKLLWARCSTDRAIRPSGERVIENRGSWSGTSSQVNPQIRNRKSQMDSLAQALKATDLLLQGGGFGLVVIDLGDVPPAAARRVPLTSWFRFRRAVENTPTVLVVLEQEPYAKTCASVVVKLAAVGCRLAASGQWPVVKDQEKNDPAHARILSGFQVTAEILRSTTQQKKPVQSAHSRWESKTAWAG